MQRTFYKNYDYTPYGKILWQDNNKDERLSFLGKEKDEESDLGDYGVRKYDDLTGRFTATDPLWEKYYGWSPYVYSANNPVNRVDRDGRKIIPINLNEMELKANEKKMQIAKEIFANSPTVMNIIKTAEGENTMIHIYSMSDDDSEQINSSNFNFSSNNSLDKFWNDRNNATARTIRTQFDINCRSDVLFDKNSFTGKNLEHYDIIEFLDELMHSTQQKIPNYNEHKTFYKSLVDEIENGTMFLPYDYELLIRDRYNIYNSEK